MFLYRYLFCKVHRCRFFFSYDKYMLNTLRPRQNGRHFPDDIFKWISLNENVWISIKISLKCVPRCQVSNIPALVQIMAWRRPGDRPLSEPMMVRLPTHICVTRPQWVKCIEGILPGITWGEADPYTLVCAVKLFLCQMYWFKCNGGIIWHQGATIATKHHVATTAHITMAAIRANAILVPYRFIKSLQLSCCHLPTMRCSQQWAPVDMNC